MTRMKDRGLSQEAAAQTFTSPDYTKKGKTKGSFEYQKRIEERIVTVIAKQNKQYEWIILSAWVDPPVPGSHDAKLQKLYREYQQAPFWKKLWLTFKMQSGFFL